MITLLDDYAVHQSPEPVSRPATSDRNFYDRWFFSGFTADGRLFFEAALGLYPNRRVMDAHFTVLVDGVQRCFHGSRLAPLERTETKVGPFILDVEQPMRVQRLRLEDAASGLACDLRFIARSTPGEEPPSRLYDEDRLLMHTTRFVQFGRWEGELRIDGRRLPASAVMGVRDRSWGIRPCGEPEGGAPGLLQRPPVVYWAWAPLNFDDRCTQFNTFEDPQGRPTQLAAAVQAAYADPAAIPAGHDPGQCEMRDATLQVRWKAGTRHPEGAVITMRDEGGADWRIELQPLATLLTKGIGYQHPEWGHGLWKGELALGHERWRLEELDPLRPDHVHVHQLVRAHLYAADGERAGVGVLETMCFGPHAPSGFQTFLDGASGSA
ncbi:MAG: hypothetical protein RBS02_05550 [Steroidobacteraceae bacterium]|jgi:hypothetical protein|nr:hypothetical protein [Steroidobacteraceae bacterium]